MKENAVVSLEQELNDTVRQLVEDAQLYANYAGRKRMIKRSDIAFADQRKGSRRYVPVRRKGVMPAGLVQRNRLARAVARHPAIVQ